MQACLVGALSTCSFAARSFFVTSSPLVVLVGGCGAMVGETTVQLRCSTHHAFYVNAAPSDISGCEARSCVEGFVAEFLWKRRSGRGWGPRSRAPRASGIICAALGKQRTAVTSRAAAAAAGVITVD